MCEKADEIQELWIPGLGDICINKVDGKEVMVVASRGKIADKEYKFVYLGIGSREQRDYWQKKDKLILLPTQVQLQGLLNEPLWWLVWYFEEFTVDMTDKDCFNDTSMEEIWLAFVIEEKYNKIWTGENWQIKEDKNG